MRPTPALLITQSMRTLHHGGNHRRDLGAGTNIGSDEKGSTTRCLDLIHDLLRRRRVCDVVDCDG